MTRTVNKESFLFDNSWFEAVSADMLDGIKKTEKRLWFVEEFPIEKQTSNVYDTPVHNVGMERLCGLVGHRAQKLKSLEAVSRSIILDSAS